ncbi:phage terminase large subunit [Sinorhizobium medicae]|uniref:phage terminase large subunit n=1 Tax=Sinorhizobium medicae TaxID=110321 RepID=UPI000FDA49E4|nr:phage terminase large subunit [Sinorhizobium medicae]RVP50003.1 DNA maturase B [Sinorhizobium medicae]RVP74878.1 DNA maturase B [Sinorhizobium medicae]UWU09391.1 phage terminase large subunit [Sinorhizobium medicae]
MTQDSLRSSTSLNSADPLRNFKNFLFLVWKHLNLPVPTNVQYDIADFLQHGPKRSIIEAFRGVGKSWVTSAFVCWLLYCNPQLNILVISASKQRADDFSTFTLRLIFEMEMLAHLRPTNGQRMSKVSFDVGPARASHAPSVKSLGITSQIAGSRADVLIADDIEVPNNSDTQLKRDKLSEAIKEFDAVLKPGGRIIYLGTPQTEQSIYNLLPDRGYQVRIWPARFPDEERRAKYGSKLAPYIGRKLDGDPTLVGYTTDPQRFTDADLAERELSYGRSGFSLQFMLDTSLSDEDKFPLKLSDLIVMGLNPKKAPRDVVWGSGPDQVIDKLPMVGLPGDRWYRPIFHDKDFLDYEGTAMYVDPSGRGKDETSWAVVKMLHGVLYLTAVGASRGHGYADEVLDKILSTAKEQGVNTVLVEPNMGDGMFAQLLRARAMLKYPVTIEDADWAKSQKEARIIDTLEPIMNQHRFVVCSSVIDWDYDSTASYPSDEINKFRLFYQMTRITRQRGALAHDDRLDAVAGCVSYWLDQMSRNTTVAVQQRKDELIDAELARFMEVALGSSFQSAPRWF